jgi:hypothetical protein
MDADQEKLAANFANEHESKRSAIGQSNWQMAISRASKEHLPLISADRRRFLIGDLRFLICDF